MKLRSPVFIVFFTVFIDLLGFGILIPVIPFISKKFGASGFELGMLMASYSIMQFIFAPIWGRISDRIGRKPIILLSLVGSTTGYVLFALADSLVWLFASRILAGLAAANISTAQAVIADVMPPERRTKGMGLVGMAIGLGFTFGPAMVWLIQEGSNYSTVFWVAAALSATDLLLALLLLPETLNRDSIDEVEQRRFALSRFKTAWEQPFIPILLMTSLNYYIAFAAMESVFGYYINDEFAMTAKQNGMILFLVGLVMAVVQGGLVSRISKKIGDVNTLQTGIAGLLVCLIGLGLSMTPPMMYGSIIGLAIFAGLSTPAMTSLISQLSPSSLQGGMLGMNQSMASLGRILGPLLGGGCYDLMGPRSPFYVGAFIILIAFSLIAFYRIPEPQKAEST